MSRSRLAAAAVLAAASLLLLAGCGDSEEAADDLSGSDQQAQAQDAQAMLTARSAQTALETYAVENNGSYVGVTPAVLASLDPGIAQGVAVQGTATGYELTVTSGSQNTFTLTKDSAGSVVATCVTAGVGGCPESGQW